MPEVLSWRREPPREASGAKPQGNSIRLATNLHAAPPLKNYSNRPLIPSATQASTGNHNPCKKCFSST